MIETHLADGCRAQLVELERELPPPSVRELAIASDMPTYVPELGAALADGGVVGSAQRYRYLVVSDVSGVVAAAPVVVTDEVLVDLLCGPGLLHTACNMMRRFPRVLGMTTLCVGTALDQAGGVLSRPGISREVALARFDDALGWAATQLRAQAVIYKDVAQASTLHGCLRAQHYGEFVSLPGATLDVSRFTSLHDYLSWLGEVASEGDLRRKLRNAAYDSPGLRDHLARRGGRSIDAQLGSARRRFAALAARTGLRATSITVETTTTVDDRQLDQMHELYLAHEATARFRWTQLTRRFFASIAQLPEARFTICRAGDQIVAFSSALVLGDRFVTLRSGVDPRYARAFSLPVLLIVRDIETALELGCRGITLGPTGYELKARFGVAFQPNVALSRMVAAPLARLSPWMLRIVDVANRKAGIHQLHETDFRSAWTARAEA
jgi:hypothetical protein